MQLEYVPGACNIGTAEIARRRHFAALGLAATAVVAVALIALGTPPLSPVRLTVALPLAGAAIGWIQAQRRFCLAYGFAGTFNFGALGELERAPNAAAIAADRRTALLIGAQGLLIGLAGAALFFVAPIG